MFMLEILSCWELLLLSIVLLPIFWLVYKLVEESISPLKKMPCPPGALPLVGHLFTLVRASFNERLQMKRLWTEEYSPLFILHSGFGIGIGGYRVYLTDPEVIRIVTVKNAQKFQRSDFMPKIFPSIAKGLFASNGKLHSRQKRMTGPAFSSANLRGFLEVFQEKADNLAQLWTGQSKCLKGLRILEDLTHLSLDVIGQSAFGYNFNTILGGDSKVSDAFTTLLLESFNFKYLVCKFLIPFFEYLPLAQTKKKQSAMEIVRSTVTEVIRERHKLKREGNYAPVKKDLLDLLMNTYDEETNSRMDDEELRAQVLTFLVAGNETTSVAMAWTLYELAKNTHIQERLRSELKEAFECDRELTWETLDKLHYLENVIKESLRMHSPAEVTGRVAISDINIGKYLIPVGTAIIIPIDAIHHSSKYWSKPDLFYPERFEEHGDRTNVQPLVHIPFGCGPRMCIGNRFAMMEMKVVLATLVKKFSFSEVPGCSVKTANRMTTYPDGLKLRVELVD